MANASTALPEKPHVLVTGASGLLGRAIVPQLKSGFRLRLSDRAEVVSEGADWVAADLLDEAQTTTLLDGVDAVVHLAIASMRSCDSSAASSSRLLSSYEELMLEVNIKGTAHLFEAARRAGVKKLVYVSSLTVCLGDRFRRNYSEQDQVDPQNLYACTKLFGENLGKVYARDHGLSVICLRIGQPYPSYTFYDEVWKNNTRARSTYVAMDDIAQAIKKALVAPVSFGVYNIVSASDNPRFDITAAEEIGYRPCTRFSSEGVSYLASGDFPAFQGDIVTQ